MKPKIATTIEQSKELAKILTVESADMRYLPSISEVPFIWSVKQMQESEAIPAWSLTALIKILPNTIEGEDGVLFWLNINKYFVEYYNPSMGALYATYHSVNADDLVDACVELIVKLNELKLL